MQHVKGAKAGKKLVLAATVVTKPGQRLAKVLDLTERAFIRHFLSEGDNLVNKQGVHIRGHEFESVGKHPKRFIPRLTYLERTRGQ